jgi:2-amino-4-hydroxy-6-hydroxymethyldihydropteridine diphosphokinase
MTAVYITAHIGLGANLDDPPGQLRSAVRALEQMPDTRHVRCSSFYRSAPVGFSGQPDFVNAVCRLETSLPAHALLRALLDIERAHGRVRGEQKGGPRPLDLDLLLYGQLSVNEPDVVVPHPRLHERAFVLVPLAEIDPQLIIPGKGLVTSMLAACAGQRVEKLT